MNPKVTLQENGTVTVTDTETTTTLSKVTVDDICRLVKEDGEKVKLENNTWVFVERKNETNNGKPALVFFQRHGVETYGFAHNGSFIIDYGSRDTFKEHKITPATPETVEQYLREEAVKRYKVGYKIQPLKDWFYGYSNDMILANISESVLENNNLVFKYASKDRHHTCVFKDGQWATIIKPETITKAEAEKELGKVITD